MRRLALFAVLLLLAACNGDKKAPVQIWTSTEVAGTGLPQLLAKRFSAESGVATSLHVMEEATLRARSFGKQPDVVITNDAELLAKLRPNARLVDTFAHDDYLLVGPSFDPARVRTAATAAEAFGRIVKRDRPFCSATDVPRYRAREAKIWAAAAIDPRKEDRRYRLCRGNEASLLQEIARLHAYAIVDAAAWREAGPPKNVAVLLEGKPLLRNDYLIVLLTTRKATSAEWFLEWVMSYRGLETVQQYRIEGRKRFFGPAEDALTH
ncbi:MAG TPA: hypothetical protein VFN10_20355 [Thermoanaerobaculia bacterium]|nr:hypothetical protein [Thermoanaerobaculia bacterium]